MPNAYFITLTYDNEHLENASNELAKEWAKEYLTNYFGNDDYGKEKGRYHHHIFGNFKEKIDLRKSWVNGAINIQKMQKTEKHLARYILKLSNHSIKDKTSKIFKSKEIEINTQKYPQFKKNKTLEEIKEERKKQNE